MFLRPVIRAAWGCLAGLVLLSTAWAEHYEVFLVAGQSNCDGRGAVADLTGSLAYWVRPQQEVIIAYSCSHLRGPILESGGFKPLSPGWSVAPGKNRPKSLPSATFGPEVSFGHDLAEGMPGKRIAIIKYAEGGTSLKRDWNPEIRNRLYDALKEFVARSLAELKKQGHTATIRGMIWHQGESDAALAFEEYQTLLTNFIVRLRTDLDVPDMPFGIGEVFDNGKRDQVRAAEKSAATDVPHAYFVSASELKTSDGGTHFDAASEIELGRRFAIGMLKALDAN